MTFLWLAVAPDRLRHATSLMKSSGGPGLPSGTAAIRCRSTAGRCPVKAAIGVRVPAPEPCATSVSSGSTTDRCATLRTSRAGRRRPWFESSRGRRCRQLTKVECPSGQGATRKAAQPRFESDFGLHATHQTFPAVQRTARAAGRRLPVITGFGNHNPGRRGR
jgi:hypothetical protein